MEQITVLGGITLDTMVYPNNGSVTHTLGGMLYNTIALACLAQNSVIVPIANVGRDVFGEVVSVLSAYPNITLDGLREVENKNIHCFILFASEYGTQFDEGEIVPIRFKQVEPFLRSSSLLMITFPTGFDLKLRTLRLISSKCECPIYFDYHILALGRDSIGTRFVKKRRNWLDWVSIAQFVQFNRFEAENVWGRRIDNQNEMLSFGKAIMKYGKTEAVIVTLGKDGSIITYKSKRGVECEYIEATQVGNPIDATGCGDVYASAFAFYYVRFGNIIEACAFASKMAARKCVVSGIANMDKVFNDYHHSRRELSATANN